MTVQIVRIVLMKTWKKRFDKNFLNSVLPTSWKLQSLGAMVADSTIYESSGTGSTQQKHFELLN